MSVMNYKIGPWWPDEDPFDSVKREAKRKEERQWRKEVQQELEEMEQGNE